MFCLKATKNSSNFHFSTENLLRTRFIQIKANKIGVCRMFKFSNSPQVFFFLNSTFLLPNVIVGKEKLMKTNFQTWMFDHCQWYKFRSFYLFLLFVVDMTWSSFVTQSNFLLKMIIKTNLAAAFRLSCTCFDLSSSSLLTAGVPFLRHLRKYLMEIVLLLDVLERWPKMKNLLSYVPDAQDNLMGFPCPWEPSVCQKRNNSLSTLPNLKLNGTFPCDMQWRLFCDLYSALLLQGIHNIWAARAIFKQLLFSKKKNYFLAFLDVSCHFEWSKKIFTLPKTDLYIFSLLILHPAVGEARRGTVLPSILIFVLNVMSTCLCGIHALKEWNSSHSGAPAPAKKTPHGIRPLYPECIAA